MNGKGKQSWQGEEGERAGGRAGGREGGSEGRSRKGGGRTSSPGLCLFAFVCGWSCAVVSCPPTPVHVRSHSSAPVCTRPRPFALVRTRPRSSAVVSYPFAPVGVCSCAFELSRGRPRVLVRVRALAHRPQLIDSS